MESNHSLDDDKELPNYGDVVFEDWFPWLYQRIKYIIEEEGRLRLIRCLEAISRRIFEHFISCYNALGIPTPGYYCELYDIFIVCIFTSADSHWYLSPLHKELPSFLNVATPPL